jgi:hypothetical protein
VKTPKTAATPSSAIGGGENLTAAMRPSPPPGTYSVDWHVTSDDGHSIGGSWEFTLPPSASKDVTFENFHRDIRTAKKGFRHYARVVLSLLLSLGAA